MSQKYNIEFFQSLGANNVDNGTDLSSAYKRGSIKSLVDSSGSGAIPMDSSSSGGAFAGAANSSYGEDGVIDQSGSQFGNLWQFLGIENLSLKKKQCVYNCGIDTLGCMERCSIPDCRAQDNVNYDQCKYGCLRKGITCSTACMTDIEQNNSLNNVMMDSENNLNNGDRVITQPILTSPSLQAQVPTTLPTASVEELCEKHYDILPNEVNGVYASLDTYAPFDMRVWPKNGKFGWTLDEINRLKRKSYDSDFVIEVSMSPDLYPIRNEKPVLEFDYVTQ